jgi:hypothetical protein
LGRKELLIIFTLEIAKGRKICCIRFAFVLPKDNVTCFNVVHLVVVYQVTYRTRINYV